MSKHYLSSQLGTRNAPPVPQSQPLPGMSPNNAGGFGYTVDRWKQLQRFLILGSQGGTYYVGERELTKQNFDAVKECIAEDAAKVITAARQVSIDGRAPKNDQALFVLALVAASATDQLHRQLAWQFMPDVARTGTHLFQFVEFYTAFRGWPRSARHGVANWYNSKEPTALAYQMAKYQQRNGWSHRDLLRLSHAEPKTPTHNALFRWATSGVLDGEPLPGNEIVDVMEGLKRPDLTEEQVINAVRMFGLTREMLPTQWLNSKAVWEALLEKMPLHAMIRNLGKMSSIGLIDGFGAPGSVLARLADQDYIRKSRLHPLAILLAARTYTQGHGEKGSLKWTPNHAVINALDAAFDLAFQTVTPSGKRIVVAIDGSGSMEHLVNGASISCREGAIVMGMATLRTEPWCQVVGFTTGAKVVGITARDTLRGAVATFDQYVIPEGTDCAAPIALAAQQGWQVDGFVLYTDSESWAGSQHVVDCLDNYNRRTNQQAKCISVAMASNKTSVSRPDHPLMLDCVGFDTTTPQVISQFMAGNL